MPPRAPARDPLTAAPARKGSDTPERVPLALTERGNGRRWGLTCRIKPRAGAAVLTGKRPAK